VHKYGPLLRYFKKYQIYFPNIVAEPGVRQAVTHGKTHKINPAPLLSHNNEFPGRGLKRWRNDPVFSRVWDIAARRSNFARWAGSYNSY